MSIFDILFPVKSTKLTKDDTVLYVECFCHNFGFDGGYVVCCIECKDANPSCLERKEHNKSK